MKLGWRGALGILLSVALLVWALHGVSAEQVITNLRDANLPLLIASAAVATCTFPLRARRWRVILDPVEPNIPFGPLWRSTAVGMMVNNVVPARAGEVARAYALTREMPRVPFSTAFASLAVDRFFDALIILILLFLAMLDPAFPGGAGVTHAAEGGVLIALVLAVGLYALVFFPDRVIRLYELFARRIAPRLEARGREALVAFASGLGVLRSPRRFASVMLWTLAHWLVNALSFWVGFKAVGINTPLTTPLLLQGVIAIGVAVPAGPGFFGTFEALATFSLGLYGVPRSLAVSWAIGYHLLSFIPITVIGIWYFLRLGLHLKDIEQSATDERSDGVAPDARSTP